VDGGGTGILRMKGLPPSEAMLGRREMRACSVDLGRDPAGAAAADPASQAPGTLSPGVPSSPKSLLHAIRAAAPPPAPRAFLAPTRKVKPVADAEVLVREAIMKLERQGPADD